MPKTALIALKSLIAFAFLAALYFWVDSQLEWGSLLNDWAAVSTKALIIVVLLIFLSHFLRIARIHYAYRQNFSLRFVDVAGVSLSHNTLSFLLPMRLGEAALPILSRQKLDVDLMYSSSTLLLVRLFDAHCLALLLFVFAGSLLPSSLTICLFIALLLSIPLVIYLSAKLVMRHNKFIAIRPLVSRVFPLIMLYVITLAIWLTKIAALAYIAASLGGFEQPHAWIATIIADASALSPITGFANAGTFEAAFMLPLLPLGYESNTILKTAVNLHILIFLSNIAAGALGALLLIFSKRQNQVL